MKRPFPDGEGSRSALPRTARPFEINVSEPMQVRWWCDHFGVTYRELFDAIERVGLSAVAVRRYLGK